MAGAGPQECIVDSAVEADGIEAIDLAGSDQRRRVMIVAQIFDSSWPRFYPPVNPTDVSFQTRGCLWEPIPLPAEKK